MCDYRGITMLAIETFIKPEVFNILQALKPRLADDGNICYAVLFGSYARSEAVITSDIDIAIVAEDPLSVDRAKLREVTESSDIVCDLVYTTHEALASATRELDVNYWIKKEGIVIWQR